MKKSLIIVIVVAAAMFLWSLWYLASPLFIDNVVDEGGIGSRSEMNVGGMNEVEEAIVTGNFVDADSFHKTSGMVKVLDVDGKKYLRLENFESTNGPDLKVYLSNDLGAEDYVSLGELKGNIGNQNYEIPEGVNAEDYKYALIWCEQFSVLFGSAEFS